MRGILSLYDAAQLRIRGEEILDEAEAFTTAQLSKSLESGTISSIPLLAAQVSHALKQQMRKNLPRLESKHYMMYVYPHMASHNKTLLKLATLDFNLQQSMHRKELSVLSRYIIFSINMFNYSWRLLLVMIFFFNVQNAKNICSDDDVSAS